METPNNAFLSWVNPQVVVDETLAPQPLTAPNRAPPFSN